MRLSPQNGDRSLFQGQIDSPCPRQMLTLKAVMVLVTRFVVVLTATTVFFLITVTVGPLEQQA